MAIQTGSMSVGGGAFFWSGRAVLGLGREAGATTMVRRGYLTGVRRLRRTCVSDAVARSTRAGGDGAEPSAPARTLLPQYRESREIRLCCFVVYGVLRVPATSRFDQNATGLDSIHAFGREAPAASGVESPR